VVWIFVRPEQIAEGQLIIEGRKAHHLARVLRIRPGEPGVAVSEGQEHPFEVVRVERARVVAIILETHPSRSEPAIELTLLQAVLPHPDFDAVLEGTRPLGVARFVPVLAARSLVRPRQERRPRWQAIVEAAAEQSHRGRIPEVLPAMRLQEALNQVPGSQLLVLHPAGGDALNAIPPHPASYTIAIGPEGGWTSGELDTMRAAGGRPISLGPRILRARLAGIVAAAILIHHVAAVAPTN